MQDNITLAAEYRSMAKPLLFVVVVAAVAIAAVVVSVLHSDTALAVMQEAYQSPKHLIACALAILGAAFVASRCESFRPHPVATTLIGLLWCGMSYAGCLAVVLFIR